MIHVNVWQKSLQYCKVMSLQLIKINGKKNKERKLFHDPEPSMRVFLIFCNYNLSGINATPKRTFIIYNLIYKILYLSKN